MIYKVFLFLFLSSPGISHAVEKCPSSVEGILQLEKDLLQTSLTEVSQGALSHHLLLKLECLTKTFKFQKGMLRQVAHTTLVTLYGRARNERYAFDQRYKIIAQALIRDSIESPKIRELVLGGYSDGMSEIYKMFCGEESREYCVDMLPGGELIENQADLVSAGNMFLLRDTFEKVDLQQKHRIKEIIEKLYKNIPKNSGIKSLVIQEVYNNLMGPNPHLDLSQVFLNYKG